MSDVHLQLAASQTDYSVEPSAGDRLCVYLPPGSTWIGDDDLGIKDGSTGPYCTDVASGAFNLGYRVAGSPQYAVIYLLVAGSKAYAPSVWQRIVNFFRSL